MSKVLQPDTVEEYERLLQVAAEQQVVVQPLGGYQLIVPNEWKPPKAPKVAEPEPEPEAPSNDQTSTSARSTKEVG